MTKIKRGGKAFMAIPHPSQAQIDEAKRQAGEALRAALQRGLERMKRRGFKPDFTRADLRRAIVEGRETT